MITFGIKNKVQFDFWFALAAEKCITKVPIGIGFWISLHKIKQLKCDYNVIENMKKNFILVFCLLKLQKNV